MSELNLFQNFSEGVELCSFVSTPKMRVFKILIHGVRYYVFSTNKRKVYLTEGRAVLLFSFISYLFTNSIIFLLKKALKKLKQSKHYRKLFKKLRLRGGSNGDEIIEYENLKDSSMTLFDISLFPFSKILESVLPRPYADQFVAKFLQKCLKANTGYKIVNNELKEIIKKIFGLENLKLDSKQILAFSYDAFVFGLYILVKGASMILFKALIHFLGSLGEIASALITENLPILTGTSWGVASAIIGNFLPKIFLGSFLTISSGWFVFLFGLTPMVHIAKELRWAAVIQCEDYVKELTAITISQTESTTQKICNNENLCTTNELEVKTQQKMTYIRDLDRSDQFLVTSPDVDIHYQEDLNKRLNIPTLDGKVQLSQNLKDNPVVEWKKDREISTDFFKQDYIPLEKRTKTLSDIKHMDSSSDHKTVDTLIENHKNYQESKNIWVDAAENGL